MTLKLILIVAGSLGFVACNSSENSRVSEDDVSGVYAREHSTEVTHPETGNKLGMRTIRDLIFVQAVDGGYEISNHKWQLNDYDQDGWVNMEHADDRPLPSYIAAYDEESQTLSVNNTDRGQNLFLDKEANMLSRKGSLDLEYLKVR